MGVASLVTVRRELYEHVASSHEGWHQRDALVQRGDLLALHTVLLSAQRCVIGALHGLNRVFLTNPSMKWEQATAMATIKPWLLAAAAQTFAALLFVSTILHYSKPQSPSRDRTPA